jgi:hypothetical protein
MINICIIRANDLIYSDIDKNVIKFKIEKLEDDIEDYIEIKNVPNDDKIINYIMDIIDNKNNNTYETFIIYEDEINRYEMCCIIDDDASNKNKNNLSTILNSYKYDIINNSIILKTKINTEKPFLESISFKEIKNIIYNKLIFKSCSISVEGKIEEVNFICNPIEKKDSEQMKNIKYNEIRLYDKILMIFVELKPIANKINIPASLIYGQQICGDIVLAMRNENSDNKIINLIEYQNIDVNMLNKILVVMRTYNFDMSIKEPIIVNNSNFNIVLENEYRKYECIDNIETISKLFSGKSLNEML